jgi:DNA-directed RNA polymerase specialized sigma24 family protein
VLPADSMEWSSQRKEWVLTREALDALLDYLDADRPNAAKEYEAIRERLIKLFRWRGCLSFEEYADKTIDRVARRIAEGVEIRTTNPYALFYGVAMNLLKEHWRTSERESEALDGLLRSQEPSEDPEQARGRQEAEQLREDRMQCLRHCMRRLSSENLLLIKKYYAEGGMLDKNQRKQVADEMKISLNALRVRAFRIRSEVEQCVVNCVKEARI